MRETPHSAKILISAHPSEMPKATVSAYTLVEAAPNAFTTLTQTRLIAIIITWGEGGEMGRRGGE